MLVNYKKVVNLTPHNINFILPYNIEIGQDELGTPEYVTEERSYSLPPSGTVARCKVDRVEKKNKIIGENIDGWDITIPVTKTRFGEVEGLPEPQEGTIYIVSNVMYTATKEL